MAVCHGSVILHHRTIHPVVIREWSTPMQMYEGALLRAQSTEQRFRRDRLNGQQGRA